MTTSPSDALKLSRYFLDAFRQREYGRLWLADLQFTHQEKGNRLLYAVDTDIVVFYVTPWEDASSDESREGYSRIFHDDSEDIAVGLGYALADFLLFQLSGPNPLLVLPPLTEEIGRHFHRVAKDYRAGEEVIRQRIKKLRNALTGDIGKKDFLALLPQLVEVFAGSKSLSNAMRRYASLIKNGRFASIDIALQGDDDPELTKAIHVDSERGEAELDKLRDAWFSRLNEEKSRKKSNLAVTNDAMVLARLQWTNSRLPNKYRLMLISGDEALHRATFKLQPGEDISFGERFIRHPKCFLAEARVISPELNESDVDKLAATVTGETEFIRWLDTFVANSTRGDTLTRAADSKYTVDFSAHRDFDPTETMIQSAQSTLREQPQSLSEFQKTWQTYTGWVVGQAFRDNEVRELPLQQLQRDLNVDRLRDFIDENVATTWDACFEAATTTGFELYFAKTGTSPQARTAPVLIFDNFPKADNFVRQVISSSTQHPRHYGRAIALNELKEEDESGYTFYGAYGVLFANRGKWHIASILSKRAFNISQATDDGTSRRSGREVAYLRAVSLRHTATSRRDLDRATEAIEFALFRGAKEQPPGDPDSLRFKSERLAIELCHYLFSEFSPPPPKSEQYSEHHVEPSLPPISELAPKLKRLLAALDSDADVSVLVRASVERRILTGLAMSYVIQRFRHGRSLPRDELARLLARIQGSETTLTKLRDDQSSTQISFLTKIVYRSMRVLLDDPDFSSADREKLDADFQDSEKQRNLVGPYDLARFRFLRKLVKEGTML